MFNLILYSKTKICLIRIAPVRFRSKRETTPCNLIRDPDNIKTPRSTTKRPNLTETSGTDSKQKRILTANDMNEFFIGSEVAQQKQFTEKYATYVYL